MSGVNQVRQGPVGLFQAPAGLRDGHPRTGVAVTAVTQFERKLRQLRSHFGKKDTDATKVADAPHPFKVRFGVDDSGYFYIPTDTPDARYPSHEMCIAVALMEHGKLTRGAFPRRRTLRKSRNARRLARREREDD